MWRRRLAVVASALAVVALTACGGGGSSNVVPSQSAASSGQSNSRLTQTSAPQKQINDIYARKAVTRGSIQDPLANWVFVEPLAVTDQAVFSVPSFVTKCSVLDPIFGGLWYLSLSNFTDTLSTISLPPCTLPTISTSAVGATEHGDALPVAGNGNLYLVEIDVGFISLTTTPVAGPGVLSSTSPTWLFANDESSITFQPFHLYTFFLAEYTGTGAPTTVSI